MSFLFGKRWYSQFIIFIYVTKKKAKEIAGVEKKGLQDNITKKKMLGVNKKVYSSE